MSRGIYAIKNNQTGYIYIGSSLVIESRIRDHFDMLNNGRHSNYKLQRAYNKYKKHFSWYIIKEHKGYIDRDKLYNEEQYWIDCTEKQYNILKNAKAHLKKQKKIGRKKGWQKRLKL